MLYMKTMLAVFFYMLIVRIPACMNMSGFVHKQLAANCIATSIACVQVPMLCDARVSLLPLLY